MFNTLPARFRHYEVLRKLGSGGFGVVYLARDTNLQRLVVLKMLHPHLATRPDVVKRFLREARAMAQLDHANIVRINRVENDPQLPFFEMEYVEGQTLAQYRGSRALPLSEAMLILKQMAAALDAAHQQKMVHRDVKPGNVLIKADNTLKLTDFGIIKFLEPTGTVQPSTRGIIGTPSYMAPEQVDINRKGEIGPATDIYALGVVAYQLLTGHLPFSGGPQPAILHAHAYTPPPDPRTFNRYLPHPIAQVLLKALSKAPYQRYPSAMAFVNALEQAALGDALPPLPPPSRPTTAPVTSISGQATPNVSQTTLAPSAQVAWPMLIGFGLIIVLMACIIGLLLRPVLFEPTESAAVIPTEAPAEPTEAPAEPTEAPAEPTEAPAEPTEAPAEPTEAPAEPTEPPTPEPTLAIGSTMPGQDGMTLFYVPAGEFLMGSEEDDSVAEDDQKPQRTVYLDVFWIDETEVTNEMYAAFLNQQGNQVEEGETWLDIDDGDVLISESGGTFEPKEGFANHPVIEVTWYGAKAYCEWAGRRLPTEAEWEKAARGTDGRTYPWGNEDVAGNLVNLCDKNCEFSGGIESIDDGYVRTAPVATYPDGASPYQALDMAGNVWEWAADWYEADYYKDAPLQNPTGPKAGTLKALRGGSWYHIEAPRVRAGFRYRDDPAVSDSSWGFRCARSP